METAIKAINNALEDDVFDTRRYFEVILHNFENLKTISPEMAREHLELLFHEFIDIFCTENTGVMLDLGWAFWCALERCKWSSDMQEVYVLGIANHVTPIIGKGH